MLFTDSILYDSIGIGVALLAVVVAYFKYTYTYWKGKGIEGPEPSIPFGNAKDVFTGKKPFGVFWSDIYFYLKSKGLRHGGVYLFLRKTYVVVDLQLVKNVLQNDFPHFLGHGSYVNEEVDPLSANVFNLEGPKWKSIRTKLTPTFTSGKMKMMFQTVVQCAENLKSLLSDCEEAKTSIDIKSIMARFTTDVIGTCAFGIDCNSMKNPDSEFRKFGQRAVELDFKETIRKSLQLVLPHWFLSWIKYTSNEKAVNDFFYNMVEETVKYRENNNIVRKDFMHLLIQLKNKGTLNEDQTVKNGDGALTLDEVAAQSVIFFFAGFETSSTTLNFATYELTQHPDVQEKLREEINSVLKKYDDKITYEAMMEMTYMDKVIHETLRMFPPVPMLFRVCSKDYKVPDTDLILEKGTSVMIPIAGIHRDPEYYPNPDKFDPERFSEESKAKRPQFTWLPFGEGPRICIGLRFGMMQTKLGLITLLRNFRITLNEKTKTPLKLSTRGFITSPEGGVWLDLHKLRN